MNLKDLKIKLFLDSADFSPMTYLGHLLSGVTTNPTLMRQMGVSDYESFIRNHAAVIAPKPVSFEVIADDLEAMDRQARKIGDLGLNIYVKIPVMTTRGSSTMPLVRNLSKHGYRVNVTAITTYRQAREALDSFDPGVYSIISVFAGRIADTGCDPVPVMARLAQEIRDEMRTTELLWASTREVYNIVQAEAVGCHIITLPKAILDKALKFWRNDLFVVSQEMVEQFYHDAQEAGFTL